MTRNKPKYTCELCMKLCMKLIMKRCTVCPLVSDSLRSHKQYPTRLPHPWYSPGKNTGVGCHFLLQCEKVNVSNLGKMKRREDALVNKQW